MRWLENLWRRSTPSLTDTLPIVSSQPEWTRASTKNFTVQPIKRTIRAWASIVDVKTKRELTPRQYSPIVWTQSKSGTVRWDPRPIKLKYKGRRSQKLRTVSVVWHDRIRGGKRIISLDKHAWSGSPMTMVSGDSLDIS